MTPLWKIEENMDYREQLDQHEPPLTWIIDGLAFTLMIGPLIALWFLW
jgi:hypothetical protein